MYCLHLKAASVLIGRWWGGAEFVTVYSAVVTYVNVDDLFHMHL